MDFNYFIIGEKYNISALAIEGSFAEKKYAVFKLPTGRTFLLRAEDFEAVSPENGTKNTDAAPKYDPNREFRKGDKVRLVQCNGRNPFDSFNGIEYLPDETIYTVDGDEYDNGKVELCEMDSCDTFEIHHSNIELVSPVEELEPYIVVDAHTHWDVADKNMKTVAMYSKGNHPNAKEAAEAERDRLNDEYRKERENG